MTRLQSKPKRDLEEYLTPEQVAARLQLGRRVILRLVQEGAFPRAAKPSRRVIRIPASDVEAWLDQSRVEELAQ